jgi:hypothetical protein
MNFNKIQAANAETKVVAQKLLHSGTEVKHSSEVTFCGNAMKGAQNIAEQTAYHIAQRTEFKKVYEKLPDAVKTLVPQNGNFKHLEGLVPEELIEKLKSPEISKEFKEAEPAFLHVVNHIGDDYGSRFVESVKSIKSPALKDFVIKNKDIYPSEAGELLSHITDTSIRDSKIKSLMSDSSKFAESIGHIHKYLDPQKADELILNACNSENATGIVKFKLAPYLKDNNKKIEILSEINPEEILNASEYASKIRPDDYINLLDVLPKTSEFDNIKKTFTEAFFNNKSQDMYDKGEFASKIYKIKNDDLTKNTLDKVLSGEIEHTYYFDNKFFDNSIGSLSKDEDKLKYINNLLKKEDDYQAVKLGLNAASTLKDSSKAQNIILNAFESGKYSTQEEAVSNLHAIKDDKLRNKCLEEIAKGKLYIDGSNLIESLRKIDDK